MKLTVRLCAAASLWIVGCSSSSSNDTPADTGVADTGAADTAPADTGTGDTAEAGLTYPPGPYGVKVGDTFPDLTWDGVRAGTTTATKISSIDYYDPTGDRGVRAFVVLVNAIPGAGGVIGCAPCEAMYSLVNVAMAGDGYDWKTRGVKTLELATIYPALPVDVAKILAGRGPTPTLDEAAPLADTATGLLKEPFKSIDAFPTTLVVNPRTMKITFAQAGMSPGKLGAIGVAVEKVLTTNGAKAKPFSPEDLPGLSLWLDGNIGLPASGTVSRWDDRSGKENNFSQATTGKQPTIGAVSGGRAVKFDPSTFLSAPSSASLVLNKKDFFFAAVVRSSVPTTGPFGGYFYKCDLATSPYTGIQVYANLDPGKFGGGLNGTTELMHAPTASSSDGKFHLIVLSRKGSKITLRMDGVDVANVDPGAATDLASTEVAYLGGRPDGVHAFTGELSEVLLSELATAADVTNVEAFFKTRHGL